MDKNPHHEVLGTSVVSAGSGVWTCVHTHWAGGQEFTLRFSIVLTLPSGLGPRRCVLGPGAASIVNHVSRSTPGISKDPPLTDGNTDVIGRHVATRRQCLVDVV